MADVIDITTRLVKKLPEQKPDKYKVNRAMNYIAEGLSFRLILQEIRKDKKYQALKTGLKDGVKYSITIEVL